MISNPLYLPFYISLGLNYMTTFEGLLKDETMPWIIRETLVKGSTKVKKVREVPEFMKGRIYYGAFAVWKNSGGRLNNRLGRAKYLSKDIKREGIRIEAIVLLIACLGAMYWCFSYVGGQLQKGFGGGKSSSSISTQEVGKGGGGTLRGVPTAFPDVEVK